MASHQNEVFGPEGAVFTLCPSDHPWDSFLPLLRAHRIEILADVRPLGHQERDARFENVALRTALEGCDISYKSFQSLQYVNWLRESARHWRIGLLCRGGDPSSACHYSVMSRMLSAHGIRTQHLPGQMAWQGGQAQEIPLKPAEIFSIGVTRHSAQEFFGSLKRAGIRRLLDVRLNNWTQLAGFTKRDDLPFFLRELCGAEYVHELLLAPTRELLNDYKRHGGDWKTYERAFLALMAERKVEKQIVPSYFEVPTVLLCYEPEADYCHRRLVLDYLQEKWGCLKITHL